MDGILPNPGSRPWRYSLSAGVGAAALAVTVVVGTGCGNGDTGPAVASTTLSPNNSSPTTGANSSVDPGGTLAPNTSGSVSSVTVVPVSPGTVDVSPTTSASAVSSSTGGGSTAPVSSTTTAGSSGNPTETQVVATSEPEPEPVCEDVEPPPSDEWPGVTCFDWAVRSGECTEEWFESYCDVTCGRCVPESGGGPPGPPDCSGEGLPQVSGGDGFATRYWDCCQPHCAQQDGHKCSQDGTTRTGDGTSSCNGGGSFACYDEAPHAVSDCLAYGYIAKANPNCGGCYRIQFTGQGEHDMSDPGSQMIKGKQMIVKVSNTGSDVAGNQFDLMVPGGGVGMFNACSRQWGSSDLGSQYGGFLTECTEKHNGFEARKACVRDGCMKIPAGGARDGCLWFVDWLQIADNPRFTSQQTDCPF